MPGDTFGHSFRVTTAGESHGPANVAIIEGCPPGIPLEETDFSSDLNRRRPGQSKIVTQRSESDTPEILSGVFQGETTGTAISLLIRNKDYKSRDYSKIRDRYRPGHADYSYEAKYGRRDWRGGGRASARETVMRVAAGVIAKKILRRAFDGEIVGYVTQIGTIEADVPEPSSVTQQHVENRPDGEPNLVRCPDYAAASQMIEAIKAARKDQDSLGGVAEICATNVPAGLGEPVFDKLKADFGKALFSIPAVVGVEYGIGFGCATLRGSENNDDILEKTATGIRTKTNRHGGMLGGISTGMPIVLRAVVKPTSSLPQPQRSVTTDGSPVDVRTTGRHDPCVLPRFVPIGEAMVAIVLADHWLRWRGQCDVAR